MEREVEGNNEGKERGGMEREVEGEVRVGKWRREVNVEKRILREKKTVVREA